MNPNEAREFGLIDEVVVHRPTPDDTTDSEGAEPAKDS